MRASFLTGISSRWNSLNGLGRGDRGQGTGVHWQWAQLLFPSACKGATNRAWFSTDELDALLDTAQAELDDDKQADLYHQVQEYVVTQSPGRGWEAWRSMRSTRATAGLVTLVILIVIAVFAPLFALHDPSQTYFVHRLVGPNSYFPLGTDSLGRDIWSQMVYGSRISL